MADDDLNAIEQYYARTGVRPGDGSFDADSDESDSSTSDSSSSSVDDTDSSFSDNSSTNTSNDTSSDPTGGGANESTGSTSPTSGGGSGRSYSRNPIGMVDRSGGTDTTQTTSPDNPSDRQAAMDRAASESDETDSGETMDASTETPGPGAPDFDRDTGPTGGRSGGTSPDSPADRQDAMDRATTAGRSEEGSETVDAGTDSPGPGAPDFDRETGDNGGDSDQSDDNRTAMERYLDREDTIDSVNGDGGSGDSEQSEGSETSSGDEQTNSDAVQDTYERAATVQRNRFGATNQRVREQIGESDEVGEAVVEAVGENTDRDISQEDLVIRDGEVAFSEGEIRERAVENLQGQTDADVSAEDVTVEETESGVVARPTDEFQRERAIENFQSQSDADVSADNLAVEETESGFVVRPTEDYQRERAAETLGERIASNSPLQDADVSPEDLVRTDDGYRLSDDATDRLNEQAAETQRQNIEDLPEPARRQIERAARADIDDQRQTNIGPAQNYAGNPEGIPEIDTDADTQTVQTESGTITAGQRTDSGGGGPETDKDVFSGVVSGTEDALSAVAQAGNDASDLVGVGTNVETTRVEFQGEGSVVNNAREEVTTEDGEREERFGGEGEVESGLRDAAQGFDETVIQPTASAAGDLAASPVGAIGNTIRDPFGTATGTTGNFTDLAFELAQTAREGDSEDVAERLSEVEFEDVYDAPQSAEERRATAEGAIEGAGGIANLPGLGVTLIEGGEFVVAGGEAIASGEGGEFAQEAGGAAALLAARTASFAQSNPNRFTGQIAGSVAATGGLIGAGRRVAGSTGGRAASLAVQPGEEAAIFAARRGVPGTRRLANTVGDVDVRAEARRLAGDDRGQVGLGGGRRRSGTDSEGDSGTDTITSEDLEVDREPRRPPEERTDLSDEEVRQRQVDRNVRGAEDDRFQAGRGDTMMERRAQRRRDSNGRQEQAQRREVTESDDGPTPTPERIETLLRGTESRTDAAQAQRAAAAQEQEQTPGQRPTVDTDDVTTPRINQNVGAGVRGRTEIGGIPGFRTELDTGLRSEINTRPRTEIDVGTRIDTRQETRTRTENRQETRQETRARTESRQETRQEIRSEFRFETRREADIDPEDPDNGDDERFGGLFGGVSSETLTDFRNPLTGDVLETQSATERGSGSGSGLPGFPGGSGSNSGPDLGDLL